MLYAQLGSSGLKVSRIALGMMSYGSQTEREWHLSQDEAEPIVRRAVEAGVTFFDTADTYSDGMTEEITGRLLAKLFSRRDDYVLATKVFFPMGPGPNDRGLSRKHVLAGIDASLRRLGSGDPDRGDDGSPQRCGAGRQGALYRGLEHVRLAVRQGAAHRAGGRVDPVHLDAEPLQPGLPRGGAGDDPVVP